MSEFRRKLLSKNHKTDRWVEIAKITTIGTTEVSLPKYKEIGFFVVGGGGSGHGDFVTQKNTGNGGNGGCVNSFIVSFGETSCSVTVGRGGGYGYSDKPSSDGSKSFVSYNGTTYTSNGGYGGSNTAHVPNTKQENSGIGGCAKWGGYNNETMYQWCANHIALEKYPGTNNVYGGKGEDGLPNPFDKSDTNLYGAGGGASQNTYNPTYIGPAISGGIKGGGHGGYRMEYRGENGSFYGAGGGGGAFSATHSVGGTGYQGIVIIYGKNGE